MLEAIREIGKKVLEGDSEKLLDNLILDPPKKIKDRKQHLIIIKFKTFDRLVDLDFEEIKGETAKNYFWVGNAGANSPQIYFTTTKLSYLLSQTITNLIAKAPQVSKLKDLMVLTQNEIFYNLGFTGKYKYILDGEKVGFFEKGYVEKFLKNSPGKKESDIFESLLKQLESKVSDFIKLKTGLMKKDIILYTLAINERLMVEDKEYHEIIVKEKIDSLFKESKGKICSCCNERKPVTDSPKFAKAKSALGCYITDKVGFSSGLSGEFTKNFILCRDCYRKLLVGEVLVRNNLRSYIGGLNLYIIPKFFFPTEFGSDKLSRWAEYISGTFNSVKSLQGLKDFEEKLSQYRDFELDKNNFILNLLFWRKGTGSETKVLRLIKDVPPTRLDLLRRTANEIKDIGDRILGESGQWIINIQRIYYLLPLRKTRNEIEYQKILNLYDAIFSGIPISYNFLVNQFIELVKVYRFEKFIAYNIGKPQNPNTELVYAMMRWSLFFLYLRKLNLLKDGGEGMDYDSLQLNGSLKDFIHEMEYDEPRVALFLLGYLMGEIGNAQSKLTENRTKPILDKITYEGMNPNKLIRLTNEVFEKLNQYKTFSKKENKRVPLLYFNEGMFNQYKTLIDKQIGNWLLSDQENVFYILSGYAYATYQPVKASTQKLGEAAEEVKENEQRG